MQSLFNSAPAGPVAVPLHGFRLLVEPEPWLRTFLHNLADLFRPQPPLLMNSRPGRYWPDAQVHRPVAWTAMRQSFLAHLLAVVSIYGGSLWWLSRPRVLTEDLTRTTTLVHYQLSEYLPAVDRARTPEAVPVRPDAQKADPEYSPQQIVTVNPGHNSTRQTIIQPDLTLLQRDVPLPNLMAWTPIPGTAPMARHPLLDVPPSAAQVIAPPQEAVEHSSSRLVFPLPPQPEVIPPPAMVANRSSIQIPAPVGAVVVPPSAAMATRDPSRLQIPAMAPPQVAAPASGIASTHSLRQAIPASRQEVVAPPQQAGQRNLRSLGIPDQSQSQAAIPPAPPAASGANRAEAREIGQLLALNARPVAPTGALNVPQGTRNGEFVAGPEGHMGASAAPETRKGDTATAEASGRSGAAAAAPSSVYVAPPPAKISGSAVVSAPAAPSARADEPGASSDAPSMERIENQVFGGRRRYSLRLNMPNLTSATGSWIIRFAELKAADASSPGEISSPEPVRKVDPLYPAALRNDRVEGVVILHAIIRTDGSVGDVRVLEGFNDELDANARTALEQWRFRPGTRNGVPVDVEAVIRVPFRVPRQGF
jgi:TonB family protein